MERRRSAASAVGAGPEAGPRAARPETDAPATATARQKTDPDGPGVGLAPNAPGPEARPGTSRTEAEPPTSRLEADARTSRLEADARNPRPEAEPPASRTEAEPPTSRLEADPRTSRLEADPRTSRPEAEPPASRTEAHPGTARPEAGPRTPRPEAAAGPVSAEADGGEAGGGEGAGVFKVRLSNFEGPFDLLLQLIAKHKLDVTEVALSKVTDEFMAYIRAMGPDWDLDETTEFLVVAATLLDLKAARLLPAAEVEDEADLALLEARDLLFARLLQYRAYKQIADIFNRRLDEEARRYPRTVGLEPHHAELLPEVVISIGPDGFARLAVKAMQPKPKPQVYVDHIHAPLVSVQEQAAIVVARLRELGEAGFRTLVEDTDDTLTVVARFLALLELYREKAVALEQETALGELTVRWTGGDGDGTPRVTDEFDRPPERPEKSKEENKP
ncbi:segregation/condensation protein A [Streptomyces sp. NPDC085995]|uniref:segregation and condensation protein A n=1 Tax=Streptomyces sp. NPDC085995 TaxID=3154861 RepID=UPI003431AC9F